MPLLVLTADRPPELRDVGAGQSIDQLDLYGRAAKWFVEVGTHEPGRGTAVHHRALACRALATAVGRTARAPCTSTSRSASRWPRWASRSTRPIGRGAPAGSPWTELSRPAGAPDAGDLARAPGRRQRAA